MNEDKPKWFKNIKLYVAGALVILGGIIAGYKMLATEGLLPQEDDLQRINKHYALEYITKVPQDEEIVFESEDDTLTVRRYNDGTIYVLRAFKLLDGSIYYYTHWMPKAKMEDVLNNVAWSIIEIAYAGDEAPSIKCKGVTAKTKFKDRFKDSTEGRIIKTERTYENGCIVIFNMDIITGAPVEILESCKCPE